MEIRPFCPKDEAAVIQLWHDCELTRPWNDPLKDIARKLSVRPEWFLVGELEGEIIASVMFGYDGHRGSVNYLAVSPAQRGNGWGRLLMSEVERLLAEVGCPKINLLVRSTNSAVLKFYERLGYTADEVISLGKRLIPNNS